MTHYTIIKLLAAIVALVLALPALLGIVDAWAFAVLDHAVTGLVWDQRRSFIAIFSGGMSALVAISVFGVER